MNLYIFIPLLVLTLLGRASACDVDLAQNYSFNYLSVNNGLSQNSVTSIIQDSRGFIWIGTYDGLNRFDGSSNTIYRHTSHNKFSLSDNRVLCLYESAKGQILIGTDGGGVNILNPADGKILTVDIGGAQLPSNTIQTLSIDADGHVWAGSDKGLAIITESSMGKSKPEITFPASFKGANILSLATDRAGNTWIGTDRGLYMYRKGSGKMIRPERFIKIGQPGDLRITALFTDEHNSVWVAHAKGVYALSIIDPRIITARQDLSGVDLQISAIKADREGNLWISSKTSGLYRIALNSSGSIKGLTQYHTQKEFCNLVDNSINTLFVDRSNTLWVGTYQKGINYTDLSPKNFFSFYPMMSDKTALPGYEGKYISAIAETGDDLWVGTFNEGLYRYNKCTKQLFPYKNALNSKSICSLVETRDKTLWIGTENGLYKVLPAGSTYKISTVKDAFIARSICEDRFNNLWIGTWGGILIYNRKLNQFKEITVGHGLSSNSVYIVYQDPYAPVIWAGTIGGGLNRISYDNSGNYNITVYKPKPNNVNSLSSNHVWCLHRDRFNSLWVGTDAGLNKLSLDAGSQVKSIQTIDVSPLADRKIMAIMEDKFSNLWLSSSQGLFRFNNGSYHAKLFSYEDGLLSSTLTEAAFNNGKGVFYFGSINGLNYFKPEKITSNAFHAQTGFTGFRLFNRTIKPGEEYNGSVILQNDINYTNKINLSYKQNDFVIEFASLHFAAPENNKFRYKLEGYDKNWIETDFSERIAAYGNLDPGKYRFLISSSNNDGVYSKHIRTLDIEISPAPWATWWAKLIYCLFAIWALYQVIRYFRSRNRLKNELYREKLEKEKVTELNEIKLNFFTNITHEIRTPLNLIISPLKDLLGKAESFDQYTNTRVAIIHRNTLKLYNLINQILDLRKITSDSEKLVIREYDLVYTLLEVKKSFDWMAAQKNIRFDFQSPREWHAWFDKDKIEKVVFNLISNAFKYTPNGGTISVTLTVNGEMTDQEATISVKDTGIGVEQKEEEKIFELYYQSNNHFNSGTGIGLSLAKRLIEMHHGTLRLNRSAESGAEFLVSFPVSKQRFSTETIQEHSKEQDDQMGEAAGLHVKAIESPEINLTRKTVLIIEDNEDQRLYLKECLHLHFHLLEAADGAAGFDFASKYQPDLILTDLMMPFSDGIDVCRKVKSHAKTSHIPVIVHSVKNSSETIKAALEAGADDFIPKPYDYSMLALKINNILKSQNQLMVSMYKDEIIKPTEVEVPSLDKELLKKIVNIVEQNLSDPNFSVEKLCDRIGMSRMNLHRKLHAIVGKTASEFIREVRIKRAAQLLSSGSMRISEVMFEVGISSNSHFNKYFKEMYSVSPKEYGKQAEVETSTNSSS
ncbi:hybrid sensor histidine kinase/response regulator transcription factor [Desertivirga xinjiangensis]|uniref:hybrid sensor histidine kinase/response regulator transcription factor n=1 Tax=Desertivirga xinjiangensis TaxID=539206 RepID=UPI00210D2695|nr:two-component regulator propeller domain-containing protein [Pedobacter xinjiangensis]